MRGPCEGFPVNYLWHPWPFSNKQYFDFSRFLKQIRALVMGNMMEFDMCTNATGYNRTQRMFSRCVFSTV